MSVLSLIVKPTFLMLLAALSLSAQTPVQKAKQDIAFNRELQKLLDRSKLVSTKLQDLLARKRASCKAEDKQLDRTGDGYWVCVVPPGPVAPPPAPQPEK